MTAFCIACAKDVVMSVTKGSTDFMGQVSTSVTAGDQEDCQIDKDNEIDTDSEDFKSALEKLNETIKPENLEALNRIQRKHWKKSETNEQRPGDGKRQRLTEDQIVVGIGVHLIKKLTGKALSSPAKCAVKCPCGCDEKLDEQRKMFIGSPETWHGQLDLVSHGVGMTVTSNPIDMKNEEDEDDQRSQGDGDAVSIPSLEKRLSGGERTNLEFKQDISGELAGQLQVISQCIVFGWMEYNRHPDMSPFIPSLYMDSNLLIIKKLTSFCCEVLTAASSAGLGVVIEVGTANVRHTYCILSRRPLEWQWKGL